MLVRRAELELNNVQRNPGFVGAVLTVISDSQDLAVNQASR